jgi:hypothetical protein
VLSAHDFPSVKSRRRPQIKWRRHSPRFRCNDTPVATTLATVENNRSLAIYILIFAASTLFGYRHDGQPDRLVSTLVIKEETKTKLVRLFSLLRLHVNMNGHLS